MDKLKLHTPDLTAANLDRLAALFPNCVAEAKDSQGQVRRAIDFDLLRQELANHIVEGPHERYHLDWPGKREALLAANAPIAKTLRPCRQESIDFDATRNLFIEGDNLDALKLLQESYLGKVGMIYIDPPYNTGNDFVYEDDFSESSDAYLRKSNQTDSSGSRLVANTEANGRFHSDWLTMLYSRLKLARNLLSEDGRLVVSLDDNEVANFRKLADQVFGSDCFLFQITVLCNPKGRALDKYVANCHEYLIGYSKSVLPKGALDVPKDEDEIRENYRLRDKRGPYRELELRNTHREFGKHNRGNLWYPFYVAEDGSVSLSAGPGRSQVFPYWDDGFEGCWTWGSEKASQQVDEIVARKQKGEWKIYRKNYAFGEDGEATKQVKSIWTEPRFHTEKGQSAFNDLFEFRGKIFQSPKSVETLKQVLSMGTDKDSLVVDFFSGSGSTAHAVMALNAIDGGNRRYVMVQIAGPCAPESDALKAGFKTIAEVCKERIRRAGCKIKAEHATTAPNLDVGFRVLKVDTSNMKDVYYTPDAINQTDLALHTDNIKEDRSPEDLLFQVLVDWGVDLTLSIEKQVIAGHNVFFVDQNALAACFDSGVSEQLVKEVAKRKPLRAVFRDASFADDSAKINVEQIFKLLSPDTEVKSL
jgi:adenine-specific DNA-methyltransferase